MKKYRITGILGEGTSALRTYFEELTALRQPRSSILANSRIAELTRTNAFAACNQTSTIRPPCIVQWRETRVNVVAHKATVRHVRCYVSTRSVDGTAVTAQHLKCWPVATQLHQNTN